MQRIGTSKINSALPFDGLPPRAIAQTGGWHPAGGWTRLDDTYKRFFVTNTGNGGGVLTGWQGQSGNGAGNNLEVTCHHDAFDEIIGVNVTMTFAMHDYAGLDLGFQVFSPSGGLVTTQIVARQVCNANHYHFSVSGIGEFWLSGSMTVGYYTVAAVARQYNYGQGFINFDYNDYGYISALRF